MKIKVLNSCRVKAQPICVFVFAYAKSSFSHNMANMAQICVVETKKPYCGKTYFLHTRQRPWSAGHLCKLIDQHVCYSLLKTIARLSLKLIRLVCVWRGWKPWKHYFTWRAQISYGTKIFTTVSGLETLLLAKFTASIFRGDLKLCV